MRDNHYLVTGHFKNLNLTITNMPILYWDRDGMEFDDPHWMFVILSRYLENKKPIVIDYLDYINAKNRSAHLYELPKNDKIKIVF